MLKTVFKIIFTVVFSTLFLILTTIASYYICKHIFRIPENPAFFTSILSIPFFIPPIFLGSILLSRLILRINRRGRYLYYSIPLQYIIIFTIVVLLIFLSQFTEREMFIIEMWTVICSIPLLSFIGLFILDRISLTGNEPSPYYYTKIDLKRENRKLSKSNLPGYYEGE